MRNFLQAARAAFSHTIPVLTGYLFLGMAFGMLLDARGYGVAWAFAMSLFIYTGSMQFVAAGLLAGGFQPVQAALVTLMVNARHIFYGLAMLDRFRDLGRAKAYMVFSLTDETFSLLCSAEPPDGVDGPRFFLAVAVLDHLYWITGSVLGSLVGAALHMDTTGIDFVMTALFTVIFLEQWITRQGRVPALMGLAAAIVSRLIFGAELFILPTMLVLVVLLLAARRPLERGLARE